MNNKNGQAQVTPWVEKEEVGTTHGMHWMLENINVLTKLEFKTLVNIMNSICIVTCQQMNYCVHPQGMPEIMHECVGWVDSIDYLVWFDNFEHVSNHEIPTICNNRHK